MINTWADLVVAVKAWWHAPIKLERKQQECCSPEEIKRLPDNVLGILNAPSKKYQDMYYEDLRERVARGERLSADERYRMRMHEHLTNINNILEHPDD